MKFHIDIDEGDQLPNQWFSFGKVLPSLKTLPKGDYYQIRFPIYKFERSYVVDVPVWKQLIYFKYSAPFPLDFLKTYFGYMEIYD